MIYNAPSIYKIGGGGGGGGYKDGGELVDADFIEVENNSISSYENVSRDPVNFYFEYEEGGVLNSVINFSTQVNSTVNVYIHKNGIWFLLGIIGVNTVNANTEYIINITGNSYEIEETTDNEIGYIDYDGNKYKMIEVDGIYWPNDNFRRNGTLIYYTWSEALAAQQGKWRLPTHAECSNLRTHFGNDIQNIKSTTGWNGNPGNNSSGLNFKSISYQDSGTTILPNMQYCGWCRKEGTNMMIIYYNSAGISFTEHTQSRYTAILRLVYDPNL